jgi:hypothetical protein
MVEGTMNEEIKFWRGTPINELDLDQLREALAEVYRDLERLTWEVHQHRVNAERGKKRGKKANLKLVDPIDQIDEAHAA